MKTRNLLTIGAVIVTAITFNATASDALLTPRAAGNQVTRVSGTVSDVNLIKATAGTVSPRATGNRLAKVAGVSNEVNPATLCSRNMVGSPKMIQACAANPLAPMPCCSMADAK